MITVNKAQLHSFLYYNAESYEDYKANAICDDSSDTIYLLTEVDWQYLKGCKFHDIVADQHMGENHPGGDDIVGIADDILKGIQDGFQICTWYGSGAEAMVVGYRASDLTITEPPKNKNN